MAQLIPQHIMAELNPGPGGGGHLHRTVTGTCRWWGGGGGGGWKPDPVSNRSVHKKYTLSQYTLLKPFICIPCERGREFRDGDGALIQDSLVLVRTESLFYCVSSYIKVCCVPHAPSLVPRSRAWHKHCGLGTRLGSDPVINGVARQ